MRKATSLVSIAFVSTLGPLLHAQGAGTSTSVISVFAAKTQVGYRTFPNLTYVTANNYDAKLDMYQARDASTPQPTVIYIHGGGWTGGSKEASILSLLPYFEMGWNVVNVEYRLARVSLAPAAVEDCMCALRWVIHNAKQYNVDINRIVVTGNSAGGHLALTTGMIPAEAGLDRECPGPEALKVAAIVNWYGITDVADLLDGDNMKTYAVTWLGSMPNRVEIAKRVSPLTYVRPGLPPILTIQGDADPTVPYSHSLRLQAALEKAGVPNKLVTVPGGLHGNFKPEEYPRLYGEIRDFLTKYNLLKRGS
jgi:acetyl esterase/lipase